MASPNAHQVRCPNCDALLRLTPAALAAKAFKCPRCGGLIRRDVKAVAVTPRKPAAPPPEEEDEAPAVKPRKGKKKARPKKSSSAVLALALGGGVLAVAVVAVGVVLLLNVHGNNQQVVQTPPPPPGQLGPVGPPPGPNPPQPPNQNLDPGNVVPVAQGGKDVPPDAAVPEIPPLPPPEKRPTLLLDAGGHNGSVRNIVFSPDSRFLVSVSTDKTLRVWNTETGETEAVIHLPVGPGRQGGLFSAAVSRDGRRIAVGGLPFSGPPFGDLGALIHVISMETGEIEMVLRGHAGTVRTLAFSPNGQYLASGSYDNTVRVTDLTKREAVAVLQGHKSFVTQVSWSPDGGRLATSSDDRTVMLWQLGNPRPLKVIPQSDTRPCFCAAFSPDGQTLAAGSGDGRVRFFTADGAPLRSSEELTTVYQGKVEPVQVFSLAWTPDGKDVVYGGVMEKGYVGVVTAATGKKRLDFDKNDNTVMHVAVSPDGRYAASTGGNENQTYLWSPADGRVFHELKGRGQAVWGVAWSADGKSLVWGYTNRHGGDNLAPLGRTFRLDELDFGPPPKEVLRHVMASAEGWSLKRTNEFYEITILKDGKPVKTYKPPEGDRIFDCTLLPGARMVVTLGTGLETVDLTTGKARPHVGHTSDVTCVAPSPDGRFFVTGGTDQTVRVWHPDKAEPVLSLFFAGRDWIAWTPEGYYAASPYGEQLMGWQVNNGVNRLATFMPASRFHASLFQPEVIQNLLPAGGNLGKAVAIANRDRRNNPVAAVNLTQVMPPTVTLTAPAPGGRIFLKEPTVEVKATAEGVGKYPVKSMRLIVDGRPWQGQAGLKTFDGKSGAVEATWTVKLPPGSHVLGALAESAVSKGMSQRLEVVRQGATEEELPNLYILAVGVSAYPGKLRLQYAASDAQLVTKAFQERTKGVFRNVEVRLFLDKDGTRKNVLEGLDWLASVMKPEDVGLFYFSGHGGKDAQGNFYLIPVDVSAKDLEKTAVPGKLVADRLGNMPGKLICMMDACHSGTVAEELQPGRADNMVRELVSEDYGVVTMCSSMGREYSMESPQTKAGFFTLSIAEALSGKADFNKDHYVYIHEVDLYAALRVQELSGGMQNPVTGRPPTIRSFPLARVTSGP